MYSFKHIKPILMVVGILVLAGCKTPSTHIAPKPSAKAITIDIYVEDQRPHSSGHKPGLAKMPHSDLSFPFHSVPTIGTQHVVALDVLDSELGPCLYLQMDEQGTQQLFQITRHYPERRLLLFIDDEPAGFMVIQQPIEDGVLLVFTEATDDQLNDLLYRWSLQEVIASAPMGAKS
jgi:uncharacterized protein YceK